MNPFAQISVAYKRWRHSRGYGVHSPFAFSIVENVINPGIYGFYGYSEIEKAFKNSRDFKSIKKTREFARFILRLINHADYSRVIVSGKLTAPITASIKATNSDLIVFKTNFEKIYKENPIPAEKSLFIGEGDLKKLNLFENFLSNDVSLFLTGCHPELGSRLEMIMQKGVMFSDSATLLAIPRKEMAFVNYECLLPS